MAHAHTPDPSHEPDVAESIVHVIPWLIPLAGAILMFLLAFIAVMMG